MQHNALDFIADTETDFRDSIDETPKTKHKGKKYPQRGYRLPKVALMWLLMEISFSNASGVYLAKKFGISEAMISKYKSALRKDWNSKQQNFVLYRKDGSLFF